MIRMHALAVCLTSSLVFAQTAPGSISFNARLTDTGGSPITGSHALGFSIYDAASGGGARWTENVAGATFSTDGVVYAELGATTPLTPNALNGSKLFLEITVDGTVMTPRLAIVSVPYAIRASVAASAETLGTLTEAAIQKRVTGMCNPGQAVRSIDAAGGVQCETLSTSTGDITSVTTAAGSGLTGGSATGDVPLSLITCAAGEVLKHNGTAWACAADASGSSFTAGTGLSLSGSTLSIDFAALDNRYAVGLVPTNVGTSCKDIKTRNPAAQDGLFLIDIDGSGSAPPFQVYCDMTRDGGGWTLIMRNWYQSGLAGVAGGRGSPTEWNNLSRSEPYKLPDTTVRAIVGTDNNFDLMADQIMHNTAYAAANNEYVIVRNYTGLWTYTAAVPESSTATVFESYQAHDNALAWRGRLACGPSGAATAGYGINCENILTTPNPIGASNPQGSLGCLIPLSGSSNAGWHNLYMGATNTDTYIYICNGAQHTSSYSNIHRWWVR